MPPRALDEHDWAALREAENLIRDVPRRHPHEVSIPVITAMQVCIHDIDVLRRYLEEATT